MQQYLWSSVGGYEKRKKISMGFLIHEFLFETLV